MAAVNGDRYPPDWDQRRQQVYKRDDYQCQRCGARGGPYGDLELHCHHITSISDGGSHELSNLTTLCWRCHDTVHDHHIPKMSDVRSSGTDDAHALATLKEEFDPDDYTPGSRPYIKYWLAFLDFISVYTGSGYHTKLQSIFDVAYDWYHYTQSYQQLPPSHFVRDFDTELQELQRIYSNVDDAYISLIQRGTNLPEKPTVCTEAERFITTAVVELDRIITHADKMRTASDIEELQHHYKQLVTAGDVGEATNPSEAVLRGMKITRELQAEMRQRMEPATTTTTTPTTQTGERATEQEMNHSQDTDIARQAAAIDHSKEDAVEGGPSAVEDSVAMSQPSNDTNWAVIALILYLIVVTLVVIVITALIT